MIRGVTFENQVMKSSDFAHFENTFLNGQSGITKGCGVSASGASIYVQTGYFIIYGRMVNVSAVETITPDSVASGTLYGKLVFEIDLSLENTTDSFSQGYFKVLTSTNGYPAITQEDLDDAGTKYQLPFARFTLTASGISNFKDIREFVNLDDVWAQVQAQNTAYLEEAQSYFDTEKATIQQMISDLEAEDFITNSQIVTSSAVTKSGYVMDAKTIVELFLLSSSLSISTSNSINCIDIGNLRVQYGLKSASTGTVTRDSISLPKSYANTSYVTIVQMYGETGTATHVLTSYANTVNTITYCTSAGFSGKVQFIAIGTKA